MRAMSIESQAIHQGGTRHAGADAKNQRIRENIDEQIEVMVVGVRGNKVRLGFRAPLDVSIQRKERASADYERPLWRMPTLMFTKAAIIS